MRFDDRFLGTWVHYGFIFNIGQFFGGSLQTGRGVGKRPINVRQPINLQIAMANFAKNEKCPTSADLLAYQLGDMEIESGAHVREHLVTCEFCAAELAFYMRYPMDLEEELTVPEAIPEPLFQLAEALLQQNAAPGSFDQLLKARR
ncbi:MAG TPA: hypothetical protein PLR83_02400 [Pyrinomonadaceae bacterium]|nr:hypothetical protein [Pyrinomonadaceae bacterium]